MLKLLAITVLLSSVLEAASSSEKVEDFLKKNFANNPSIESVNVKVRNEVTVKEKKNWTAYFVELEAVVKKDKRKVSQKMVWFSDGDVITKELYDIKSSSNIGDLVSLPFKDEYYSKENLIYGNSNAKHKVVIFSDPLCPFCRNYVPEAINYMKKYPKKFAIYYYHFPLPSLHPAAVELVKAAVALELKGRKNVVLNLYKVEVNAREKSIDNILKAFNKTMGSNIKAHDLATSEVKKHIEHDLKVADLVMVRGTPTIFFDGDMDRTKNKYKEAK
ncbi:thioredoxin domain-containing protein [Candidatus Sulfurimonas marisnigri]|nr:thioredoxin domain-containing protein [Candidatus Sulfurimonas marisnigri]